MTDVKQDVGELLGDFGKHLVKDYGLTVEQAESLELEAAELYAHDTREGWCCACEADIAFAISWMQDEPEFKEWLASHDAQKEREVLEAIGEDEVRPLSGPKKNGIDQGLRRTRNKLRAELRQAIRKVYGGENDNTN